MTSAGEVRGGDLEDRVLSAGVVVSRGLGVVSEGAEETNFSLLSGGVAAYVVAGSRAGGVKVVG